MLSIAILAPLVVMTGGAQTMDDMRLHAHEKIAENLDQAMQMKLQTIGAVKGMTVKNAPYSGEEVNEANQVLADGTRIHRETHTMVYRDSEGRTRRETDDSVMINDPVAGVTYILHPKTMTAEKLRVMGGFNVLRRDTIANGAGTSGTVSTFSVHMESNGGTPTIAVNGEQLDPKKVQELLAQAKADGDHVMSFGGDAMAMSIGGGIPGPPLGSGVAAGAISMKKGTGESLGKRAIEGVNAEGNRTVSVIKAGSIGNDRDIEVTGETWYSPELQTMLSSKHSDPRTGDEGFRLININRNEPAPYLFQVPSGYNLSDRRLQTDRQ